MKWVFILAFSLGWYSLVFGQQALGGENLPLNMSVYPNPSTTGNFTIELDTYVPKKTVTIKVFNLIGKEIYKKRIPIIQGKFKDRIQLKSASKGIYMLEISHGEQKQIRRLSFI